MSDQWINSIRAFTATNSNAAFTFQPDSGLAPAIGKTQSTGGNDLPPEPERERQDPQAIEASIANLNRTIGHDLRFIVDLNENQPIIQVLDRETGEVIRQIPSSQLLVSTGDSNAVAIRLLDTMA